MKVIMVMFDSLNREMLSAYGCDWTQTPNFKRLSEQTVTFENSYVGSMPCIPARRELHTGRHNFMHRSWGPLEPFDDSMPEILKQNGVISHLITDHQHYWEDGGATYHNRYSTYEFVRGQEGDSWKCDVAALQEETPGGVMNALQKQDKINRTYFDSEEKMGQAQIFDLGLEFIDKNKDAENWFLHLESFDPHEPFFTQQAYKEIYGLTGDDLTNADDWPPYYFVKQSDEYVEVMRKKYAALMTMCDNYLGKILDKMDAENMWEDTMLIVNTDHGYLLGEHGWWAKTVMPIYNEIAHTPLFIWDPRANKKAERREALVQTIDLPATILSAFDLELPKDMFGKDLAETIKSDAPVREYAFFAFHGAHINVTDTKHTYMHAPVQRSTGQIYDYTLMPTVMRSRMQASRLQQAELVEPFTFTKGIPVLKIPAGSTMTEMYNAGNQLFDVVTDHAQAYKLQDPNIQLRMLEEIRKMLISYDAPQEYYGYYGLDKDRPVTLTDLAKHTEQREEANTVDILTDYTWGEQARNGYKTLMNMLPDDKRAEIAEEIEQLLSTKDISEIIHGEDILHVIPKIVTGDQGNMLQYFVALNCRL